VFVFVEMEGEHLFRITCPQGHDSVIGLQQPRFKILYESGALALLDGYYREAVGSFASSMERFHEYWVRATFLQNGTAPEAFDATWKLLKQSERQYGGFLLLYLRETGRLASHLPPRLVEFRNDVVHKGEFPSRSEAADYAEQALEVIVPLYRELQESASKGIAALDAERAMFIAEERAYAAKITTILGRATDTLKKLVLQEELTLLDARRKGNG
jgi:Arc/MetJ-type ribon-helix-helix transcriptional regulator